jgi:hypothetical protein
MSDVLLDRIDEVRRRLRRVHLLAGFCQCLLALIGLLAAFFILDWLVLSRTFDGGVGDQASRAVLLLVALGVFGWVVKRTIVAELRTERDDDEIALRVERRHPKLRGRLISTVQLTREEGGDESIISAEMIEALADETVSFAEALDFGSIINRRMLKRVGLAALILVLVSGGLSYWRRDYARALVGRMSLTHTAYPTATGILSVSPRDAVVGRGDPVTIEVEVDAARVVPDDASASLRTGGKTSELRLARVLDAPDGKAVFRAVISQALDDIDIRPAAGDARWPSWEHVRVRQRPALKGLTVAYDYPTYLGKTAETTAIGDVRAPVGTKARLSLALTKPVKEAKLTLRTVERSDDGKVADATREVPMTLAEGGAKAETTLEVSSNGGYTVVLTDADGFANANPIAYTITAIPDRPPTVSIQKPAQDKMATKYAHWPIQFTARDDHAVAKLTLKYFIVDLDKAAEQQDGAKAADAIAAAAAAAKELPIDLPTGRPQVVGEYVFDLTKVHAAEGQRVTYWIEATDNREPKANVGSSPRFAFTIVDLQTAIQQSNQDWAEIRKQIKGLRDKEKEQRDFLDGVKKLVP